MSDYPGFTERLEGVRARIAAAAERSGRDGSAVRIVAVTKTHPSAAVEAVRAAGLGDVGENRVQELEAKVTEVGRTAMRWHLIGHLQRNKAKKAIELADLIHSVDSLRLARKLSEEAVAVEKRVEALIQVNPSGEESKGGLEEEAALEQIDEISRLPGLQIVGLMTMAPFTTDELVLRRVFAATRRMAEAAASVTGFEARHLSMGMSNDFEIAVEEGSTMVRLGTILLGERGE